MSSELTIQSRCHTVPAYFLPEYGSMMNPDLSYTLNGVEHVIRDREVQAIEASGRCSLWEYVSTPQGWGTNDLLEMCDAMEDRPAATRVMSMLEYELNTKPWSRWEEDMILHLRGTGCTWSFIAAFLRRTYCQVRSRYQHRLKHGKKVKHYFEL